MNEFAKDVGLENETGMEAPASVTVRGYYKGYSVLVTNRDPATDTFPLVQKAIKAIDWMIENGFKPSWADQPDSPAIKPNSPSCPICGKVMVRREGKKGDFWGCSQYPNCRGVKNIDEFKGA